MRVGNPKVRAEYDALAPEFEIAAELLRARLRAGLSQAELAARMGTSQSTIARLENGRFRAPRRSCATQKQPAANSACGYRRPDASANLARMGLTGPPSIPDTAVIESMSRGVLDAPLSRSMTVFVRRQSGMLPVSGDAND